MLLLGEAVREEAPSAAAAAAAPRAPANPPGTPPIVALRGITKTFPGVVANAGVDLDVAPGEIHALLGENGAGKSTLMNVLTGLYRPDAGEILIDGYPARLASPQDAIAAGIGMVHQHFKLVEAFTVAENVHLGWPGTPGWLTAGALRRRTAELGERFGLPVRPDARVAELSTGERQRVEILRVLAREARVLILDEPTALLTPGEAAELFAALRAFAARGNAALFISHKLDEVLEIADRVTVLRGGRKVATREAAGCTPAALATMMVGREIVLSDLRARPAGAAKPSGEPAIALEAVSAADGAGRPLLRRVSLAVRPGEILGIAGVAGNGQRALSHVLTGLLRPSAGRVLLGGVDVTGRDAAFAALGLGHIPEDRLGHGLAAALSVADNAVLREYRRPPLARGGLRRLRAAVEAARGIARAADVRVPDLAMPARNLSGGNQQRLVARREMRVATRALVAAYPSRGLDVGAIDTMMRYLAELRDAGVAVVLMSEELEELVGLADRVAVMFGGEVMGEVPAEPGSLEAIGLMMGGRRHDPRPAAAP
jgi:general nucleoside transport system ATP-binding protein